MSHQTRVTIIPFVTDEGLQGDHDFMQWDTVSLMSLLGVFVIPVYYRSAVKNPKFKNKITQQRFDYDYLLERLDALAHYNQADAYHWNVNEIRTQLPIVAQRAKSFYAKISKQTGVQMHAMRGADERIIEMLEDVGNFQRRSRRLARTAQERERVTVQPKERLGGQKATITIKNFIGGYYYWTVDEALLQDDNILWLIEKKHSSRAKLPSIADIKDACLKMILFSNLARVTLSGENCKPHPAIAVTSDLIQGFCHSEMSKSQIEDFLQTSEFSLRSRALVEKLFRDGKINKYFVLVASPETPVTTILQQDK